MSVVIPSSVLQYGVPIATVISFAGVIDKWLKSSKRLKVITIALMALLILSGLGIRVLDLKIVLPSILQDLTSVFNLSESALESIYISLFFIGITSILFLVLNLIVTLKFALSMMTFFGALVASMPLAIICTLLGLPPLISAAISSTVTIALVVICSLLFAQNLHQLSLITGIYTVAMQSINFIFILVLLINNNFGGMLSLSFWESMLDRSAVGTLDIVVHQFTLALLPALLSSIVYICITYKCIFSNNKINRFYFTLDVTKKSLFAIMGTGMAGSLLMLIPIKLLPYNIIAVIASILALAIHMTFSIIGDRQAMAFLDTIIDDESYLE